MADPIPTITDVVKTLLIAAMCGQEDPTQDWFITTGKMIDAPSKLVGIRKVGGLTSNPAWSIDYPSIQVRTRASANGYNDAEQQIQLVKNALLGIPSQDVSGGRLTAIRAIGDYLDMGVDANDRPGFAMNFSIIYEPTNAGYRQ